MRAFDLAVIGQGYAGLCAARLARRRGLSVITFESVMAGGAVMTVLRLDPSPEDFTISGPDLGAVIGMENLDDGVISRFEGIERMMPAPSGGWHLYAAQRMVEARNVVIATGVTPRLLGVPGEAQFQGRGISHCADCDGPEMIGRDCVVVGGGDAAFQEGAVLARVARSVTMVLRGDAPRARPDLVAKALESGRVEIMTGRQVVEIVGDDRVTAVRLDGSPGELPCQGLFVFIGGCPQTAFLPSTIAVDADGGLVCDARGALALPGLWAAGSVRSGFRGSLRDAGDHAERLISALAA